MNNSCFSMFLKQNKKIREKFRFLKIIYLNHENQIKSDWTPNSKLESMIPKFCPRAIEIRN